MIKQILLQIILIALNAFFAATEIAVISLNEKKVRALAEDGNKKAVKMLKIIEEPTQFLSTIQIGITLAGFLGSAFAADNFAEVLSAAISKAFNLSADNTKIINTVAVVLVTLILSYFTLIFGELVPKRIAMKHKEKLANSVCGIISFLAAVLKPIIWFLTISTNAVLRLVGIDPHEKEEPVSEEDIVLMLDAGADEGSLDHDDIEYIKNVFKLDKMTAEDVMTPRKSVISISYDASDKEILEIIEEESYSRIPVYEDNPDKIIGILHACDYLLKRNEKNFNLKSILHTPVFVPETVSLDVLFKDMQTDHNHLAVVVNEYGETSGIVTMEDILEEIVGEIWDERDEEIDEFKKIGDNTYKVLCTASLEDFREYFKLEDEEELDVSTVNGWITEITGIIPEVNYSFDYKNFDRFIDVFRQAGALKMIEGGHIAARAGNWDSNFEAYVPEVDKDGNKKLVQYPINSEKASNFYRQFLPSLMSHLQKRGLKDIYVQHIADEPIESNFKSYVEIARFVKDICPDLKIIEACHTHNLENTVDIWVPQLNFYKDGYSFYQERQKAGDEVWFYTCLAPQGNFANRFLELPSIKTRLIHWLNFRYGATGYLHWGFNFWKENSDPYGETTTMNLESGNTLPGGDSWIVYPKNGKLYSSIRLEAMRDGIADYTLLQMLAQKEPDLAKELCRQVVFHWTLYDTDGDHFRAIRHQILEKLSEK